LPIGSIEESPSVPHFDLEGAGLAGADRRATFDASAEGRFPGYVLVSSSSQVRSPKRSQAIR